MSRLDQRPTMLDRLISREALLVILAGVVVSSGVTWGPAKTNQKNTCDTMQNGGDLDDPKYLPLYYPHKEKGEWKLEREGQPTVSYGKGPEGTFLWQSFDRADEIDPKDYQAIADACNMKQGVNVTVEQVREALLTLNK